MHILRLIDQPEVSITTDCFINFKFWKSTDKTCDINLKIRSDLFVIFGTLKDGSLLIDTLASNICFGYRNMFQNGVDALSKIVDAFLSKSSKFYLVHIIR